MHNPMIDVVPSILAADFAHLGEAVQAVQTITGPPTHHWMVHKFPIMDDRGKVALIGAVSIDITGRVEAESALRESSASVGDILTQEKINALPMIGNNVLQLLQTLPGLRLSPTGDAGNTIGGLNCEAVLSEVSGPAPYSWSWCPRQIKQPVSMTNTKPAMESRFVAAMRSKL